MAIRLSIILFLLLPVIAQAQLKSDFVGICTFDDFANTTGDNYRGDILNFIDRYNLGVSTKNIQIGDEIVDGSGDVFEVLTIHSTASNFEADVTVQARVSASGAPTGSGQVYRPSANGIIPPGSVDNLGLSNVTKGLIDMHNALRLDSLLGTVANGDSIIAVNFANDSLSITMESDTVYTAIIPVDSLHQLQADSIAALYDSLGVKVDTIIAGNNINITYAAGQYTISAPDPNVGTDDQTAGEVWYNDSYLPLNVNDVQQAIDSLKRDLDAVSAGASDGVATSGTLDVGNEEIDVTVAAPGSAFSIDISGIETLGSFSGWDTDVSDDFDGAWGSLTGVPAGFADDIDDVDDADASVTNEGSLSVAAGTGSTAVINSNTSGSSGVTIEAQAGIGVTENTGTGTIFIENTGDLDATNEIQTIDVDFTGDFLTFGLSSSNTRNVLLYTSGDITGGGSQNNPLNVDFSGINIGFTGDVGSAQQIGDGEFLDLEGGFGVVTTMSTDKANFKVDTTKVATVWALADTITNLTSGVTDFEELAFNTVDAPTLSPGMMGWNSDESTVDIALDSDVTLQVGQEMLYYVKNQTGSTISDGQVVQFGGSLGSSGRLLIELARADTTSEAKYVMGVTTESIANGADGFVTAFGKVRGIDTDGSTCGETWADGTILYLSATTAGCLTSTPPAEPSLRIPVAAVVHASDNGTLLVRPTYYPRLDDLHDVTTDGAANGQVLVYNSTSGVWEPGSVSGGTPLASNGLSIDADTVELGGNLTQNTVIQGQNLYDLTFSTIDVLLANTRRTTINNNENFRASVPLFSESIKLEFELVEADTLAYINGQFTVDELGRFRPGPSTIATNPPDTGYVGYNSTTGNLEQWDGSTWSAIGSGSGGSAFWEDASGTVRTVSASSGLDFVFGSSQIDDSGNAAEDERFLFDNSKGYFAAGRFQGSQVDDANRGIAGVNLGLNNQASGNASAAAGGQNNAATGTGAYVHGENALAPARNQYAHGIGGGTSYSGQNQFMRLVGYREYTGVGTAQIFIDGSSERFVIPNNTLWSGTAYCQVVATVAGGTVGVGDRVYLKQDFSARNEAGLINVLINPDNPGLNDVSMGAVALLLGADNTNDALNVNIASIPGTASSEVNCSCYFDIIQTKF